MKRFLSYLMLTLLVFPLIGCRGNGESVKANIFDVKEAGEIASKYMKSISANDVEGSSKLSTDKIKNNEELYSVENSKVTGYKLKEVAEGANHAYFNYLVVRKNSNNVGVDLDTFVIKVVTEDENYLVDEIKAKNEKQVYRVNNTLRIRDADGGKSELFLRTRDIPKEVYPKRENVVLKKEAVPVGDFSEIAISFMGNKVAITTTDGTNTFLALGMVEESKATVGKPNVGPGPREEEVDKAIDDVLEKPIIDKLVGYDLIEGANLEKLAFSNDDGEVIVQIKSGDKGSGIRVYKNPSGELLELKLDEVFPVEKYSSDIIRVDDEGIFVKVTAIAEEKKAEGDYKIDVEQLKVFKETE